MKLDNIHEGEIISNYKELCTLLELSPANGGRNKSLQLRDIERYLSYEKQGHKFIIHEIYEHPMPKEYQSVYQIYMQKVLMDTLVRNYLDNGTISIIISKSKLISALNMANDNYQYYKGNKDFLMKDVSKDIIDEFYSIMDGKLSSLILTALNRMESNGYIKYNKVEMIDGRKATTKETNIILEAEQNAYDYFKCPTKKHLYLKGLLNEFREKVIEDVSPYFRIKYYYTAFEIIFTKRIVEQSERLYKFLIDNDVYNQLNDTIIKEHMKNTLNKYGKLIELQSNGKIYECSKAELKRYDNIDRYVSDNQTMTNKVIKNTK